MESAESNHLENHAEAGVLHSPEEEILWQTRVRESLTPFLPPPVIRGIQSLDELVVQKINGPPEASITILTTIFSAILISWLLHKIWESRTGKAIVGDDAEEKALRMNDTEEEATVILCGPKNSGKTRLFYYLCNDDATLPTLISMKANIAVRDRIRYIDWPGRMQNMDKLAHLFQNSGKLTAEVPVRWVLVLDANQPMAPAADVLYEILERSKGVGGPRQKIFIACHKSDFPKAKNTRRIQLQLRTELDRIAKLRGPGAEQVLASTLSTGGVDLDALQSAELYFAATTCESKSTLTDLVEFCRTAHFPSSS
jgi:signal recognition particle receptor subunit beta